MAVRPEKVAVVDEVRDSMSGAAATLLADYRGLSVQEMAELRIELRKANAVAHIVKNTLARRAARDAGLEGLDALLEGPNALIYCHEDPVGPAKALKKFAEAHPALEVRGGYLDGEVLDAASAMKLADLASREELLGQLVGLMYGALANTARLLNALPTKQAQLIAALIEKGGAPGAPADAPAAPAEEPAAAEATEAADEPAEEPAAEATDEPATDESAEPAAEAAEEPAAEATDEPATDESAEPAAEAAEEPAAEPTDEPAAEATDEPAAAEATDEPAADAEEPAAAEATDEPAADEA